jgi:hypothetical protein
VSVACSASAGSRRSNARARPLRRRGPQVELGQRRAQIQAGAANYERTAPGSEQAVDLRVRQLCVLAGAERRVERQERDQTMLESPLLGR